MRLRPPPLTRAAILLVALARCAKAGTFDPRPPTVTTESAHYLIAAGVAIAIALLTYLLIRKHPSRRFSFSLGWFLAFCIAIGMIVGGIARTQLAIKQKRDYRAGERMRAQLEKTVSFCTPGEDINDGILEFLSSIYKVDARLDPALISKDKTSVQVNPFRIQDMRGTAAFKLLAKAANLQCECQGNRITFTRRTKETLAADAELESKLSKTISIDFKNTPINDALRSLRKLTGIDLVFKSVPHAQFEPKDVTLHLENVEARTALYWTTHLAEVGIDDLNDGDLCEYRINQDPPDNPIEKKLRDCKITFEFVNKPLDEAVAFIAKAANVNFVIDPRVLAENDHIRINLRVTDMNTHLALEWILKLAELDFTIRGEVVWITKRADV